jgi:hypothetical protein
MKHLIARFRGSCPNCRRRIRPGQPIIHLGPGRSIHEACEAKGPREAALPGAKAPAGNVPSRQRDISPRERCALDAAERAGFR